MTKFVDFLGKGGGGPKVPEKNLDMLGLPKTVPADLQQACKLFASVKSQS